MAVSLGFHIVFAALAVGLPAMLLFAEYRANRTGDPVWMALSRRWARALGILVAVGAVSGTVLSFALGLFWPGLMGRWGAVIGLPFALEAFAFFIEAIFLGIYLFGWDRLSPWAHWAAGWPVAIGGVASAWFVVTANAWMQTPTGFATVSGGRVVDERQSHPRHVRPVDAAGRPHVDRGVHGHRVRHRVGLRRRGAARPRDGGHGDNYHGWACSSADRGGDLRADPDRGRRLDRQHRRGAAAGQARGDGGQYETRGERRCRWAGSTTTTSCATPSKVPTSSRS